MPIPALSPEAESAQSSVPQARIRLVERASEEPVPFYPRALAHLLDLAVVGGFSVPLAKIASVFVVFAHLHAHRLAEKASETALFEAFDYANSFLGGASFAALAVVYFVGLPHLSGRTLGLGIFGLRIESETGGHPEFAQLGTRFLACALNFLSGGLLCVVGLRSRDGRFLQDSWSRSRVVRG
jgi:uncharacterized RDD family membrane protein YckC